jgi:hypothetical protein
MHVYLTHHFSSAAAGAGYGYSGGPGPLSAVELEDTRGNPGFFCGDLWCGLMEPKGERGQKRILPSLSAPRAMAIHFFLSVPSSGGSDGLIRGVPVFAAVVYIFFW